MEKLPVDRRGYPVPWFVYRDPRTGEYDFRVMEAGRIIEAVKMARCWITGRPFGGEDFAFVVGPMCVFSGRSAEPPSTIEAAAYAARVCPFLAIPSAKRREAGLDQLPVGELPGVAIKSNPGITAVVVCHDYRVHEVGNGVLFSMGKARTIRWFTEGRELTPEEIGDPNGLVAAAILKAYEGARALQPLDEEGEAEIRGRYETVLEAVLRGGEGLGAFGL